MNIDEEIRSLYRRIYYLRRLKKVCAVTGCQMDTGGAARCKYHAKINYEYSKRSIAKKKIK